MVHVLFCFLWWCITSFALLKVGAVLSLLWLEGTRHSEPAARWFLQGSTHHTAEWWLLFVGYLTSQQQAGVSQGQICSDNFTCCHTEIEVSDQTFHLTQSQYTDTGPTSPSTDPITPGAWQGSHWNDSTQKNPRRKRDSNPGFSALEADALTTRPTRQ